MTSHTLLQPLQIGRITLPHRIVQGPLAGYSCAPMRALAARYGSPGFCVTEMLSAHDMLHRKEQPKRYLWRDPEEKRVSYQISGTKPEHIANATRIVTEYGADIVDLNCGCPVKKIRRKGAGSKILAQPELLYTLVRTMKENTDAAISVKIRVGEPAFDSDDIQIVEAVESAGADLLTVHGRHWTERYDVPCRMEAIKKVKQHCQIPVFANGDVDSVASLKTLIEKTQCDGVMVARASLGDPWLFAKLQAALNDETVPPPSANLRITTFIEHIQKLAELENETLAVLQSRKLAKYYLKSLPSYHKLIEPLQQASTLAEVTTLLAIEQGCH